MPGLSEIWEGVRRVHRGGHIRSGACAGSRHVFSLPRCLRLPLQRHSLQLRQSLLRRGPRGARLLVAGYLAIRQAVCGSCSLIAGSPPDRIQLPPSRPPPPAQVLGCLEFIPLGGGSVTNLS